MKKWGKHSAGEDLNIWQPATDMFSGLVLILLLVILLLSLYLVNVLNEDEASTNLGVTTESEADGIGAVIAREEGSGGNQNAGGTAGGGEGTDPDGTSEADQPDGTTEHDGMTEHDGGGGAGTGIGTGTEPDKGIKSAVFVEMVDAETDRTIKEEGVQFELYGEDDALQILNVYYPEKISFRNYETTEAGTFYFPEKLWQGQYVVHELTEPEGYDAAENQSFLLDDLYDWSEPFIVKMLLSPSKNVIRVQVNDMQTQAGVGGATFEILAKNDVLTQDGTLRYHEGEIVGEIVCDENGSGTSDELYLGEYTVREKGIPKYYAGQTQAFDCTVEKKSEAAAPLNTVETERSRIALQLTDELYENRGIAGASFEISSDDGIVTTATTDSSGQIVLEELEKDTTYTIRQTSSAEDYLMDAAEYTVYVASDGRMDNETQKNLRLTNRMLRVSIGAASSLLGGQRAGAELSLYTSDGTFLRTWTTTNAPITFTNLSAGVYYITMDGDEQKHYTFEVCDQAEVQTVNVGASKVLPYILVCSGTAAVVGVLGMSLAAIRRNRKKKSRK